MQAGSLLLSRMWGSHAYDIKFYFLLSIYLLLKYHFASQKEPEERKEKFPPSPHYITQAPSYFYKNVENATKEIAEIYVYQIF